MQKNNINKVHIKGGEVFITDDAYKNYRVIKGTVLVFLLPFSSGKTGRRFFLAEFEKNSLIPGFTVDDDDGKSWRFALIALDEAEFEESSEISEKEINEVKLSFAEQLKIKLDDVSEFESEIIELYKFNSVKDEAYIYGAGFEAFDTRNQSLEMIRDVFYGKNRASFAYNAPTGNILYDSASFLCRKEKIQIASREKIVRSAGKDFLLGDIARVSHFTVRMIDLPDKWYKKDCGTFMAFKADSGNPVCVFQKRYGKYRAYDAESGEYVNVDSKFADRLEKVGFMFYRPFPNEKITLPKLIMFGMEKVYPSDILRIVVLGVVGVQIGLLIPYLNEQVYDRFIPQGSFNSLWQFGVIILFCSLGNLAFAIVKNLSLFRSMSSMEYAVQSAVIDRVYNLPESFLRQYEAAVLGMRVVSVSQIYSIVSETAAGSLLSALLSLFYLARMIQYSKALSRWAVIILVPSVCITVLIGLKQIRYEREKTDVDQKASSTIFQFISGMEKVKISSSENRALVQYLQKLIKSRYINFRKGKLTVIANVNAEATVLLFSIIFYTLIFGSEHRTSVGVFMGFMAAFGAFHSAVFEIAINFLQFNTVYQLYEKVRPILETLPESRDDSRIPEELHGEIEIDNVSFSYEESAPLVLQKINLHIKSGEYVGIVGTSGSGKSTLLKLLMGFEKPLVGKIYYDGQDIDELDKRELRKKFGVVLQEGGLVGGSIYSNLTITAVNSSKERVEEVLRQVNLEKDIMDMPMGLNTVINENCATLSGGQIQRILIARAIMGKPGVIFLDEATSALDNVSQKQVIETLESLDATKVVIAHRLSTVMNCDRIIVMENGRIVEEGNYNGLMNKKGRFYELALRQIA